MRRPRLPGSRVRYGCFVSIPWMPAWVDILRVPGTWLLPLTLLGEEGEGRTEAWQWLSNVSHTLGKQRELVFTKRRLRDTHFAANLTRTILVSSRSNPDRVGVLAGGGGARAFTRFEDR